MADERTGLLSVQAQPKQPLHTQPVFSYGSDHGGTSYPQTGQYPSQPAGQYPAPQGGYYPHPQAVQFLQQGYISQQGQTVMVAAPLQQSMRPQQAPQDYMTCAIFATLCCFWPTGICAIIKACDARQAFAQGDIAKARESSESARKLTMISIVVGVLAVVVVCIILGVFFGIVQRHNNFNNQTLFN